MQSADCILSPMQSADSACSQIACNIDKATDTIRSLISWLCQNMGTSIIVVLPAVLVFAIICDEFGETLDSVLLTFPMMLYVASSWMPESVTSMPGSHTVTGLSGLATPVIKVRTNTAQ